MEFFAYLAFAGFVFACSIAFAFIAMWLTRNFEQGRGVAIVGAFLAPSAFVAYLLFVSHLREQYHHTRSEASNFDGSCTLPLSHGYFLWFFDETPWMSVIGNQQTEVNNVASPQLEHIQRIALADGKVFGETGKSNMLDGPPDFFFVFDPSSGAVREFAQEAQLRSGFPKFGPLMRPEDAFNAAEEHQRSILFWPAIAGAPFALATGLWLARRKRRGGQLAVAQC